MKQSAYLVALSTVLLAACGGGGSSDPAPVAVPVTGTVTTTSVGDCFVVTPGVKFVKSNGFKELAVQEAFEGVSAFGRVELRANDTRFSASYQTISGGFVHFLGMNLYDIAGVSKGKNVYSSGAQFPVDMTAGQTVQINYTDTRTSNVTGTTSTHVSYALTFVGLESLTLGGRTFANACKFKTPGTVAGQTDVSWFAQGFGEIRSESQDAQGVMVPGSRVELATIVTAP